MVISFTCFGRSCRYTFKLFSSAFKLISSTVSCDFATKSWLIRSKWNSRPPFNNTVAFSKESDLISAKKAVVSLYEIEGTSNCAATLGNTSPININLSKRYSRSKRFSLDKLFSSSIWTPGISDNINILNGCCPCWFKNSRAICSASRSLLYESSIIELFFFPFFNSRRIATGCNSLILDAITSFS